MIQYSIQEQSHFSYHIYDEKAMYPLWELQRGNRFISSTGKTIEVILPLGMKYAPEVKDNFERWYNLPVQTYGNCTRKMRQWGINLPRTFGLQQGVLYQIENCCKSHPAFQCPFINIEN